MTVSPTTLHLEHALTATGQIVAGIRPEQWDAPSPCSRWPVRQVANHLVGGLRIFTAQLRGEPDAGPHDGTDWLGADPSGAYAEAARADAAAWRADGADDVVFDLAFGRVPAPMAQTVHLTEVVVHGLDLAVATGQGGAVDDTLAAGLLATMRAMGTDAFRVPGIFDPERPAPDAAPAHRRLLAYLGRDLTVW